MVHKQVVIRCSKGENNERIDLIGITTADGLIVCVLGGDKPHVGAIALGIPRPSLKDPDVTSVTSSVLTLINHKDDRIARPMAEAFAKKLKQPTVVIAGVHVEGASRSIIKKLVSNATSAGNTLTKALKGEEHSSIERL